MANKESFNEMMNTLKSISEQLEKDDLQIDEALALYEKGLNLSKTLKAELSNYENKLKEINEEKDA